MKTHAIHCADWMDHIANGGDVPEIENLARNCANALRRTEADNIILKASLTAAQLEIQCFQAERKAIDLSPDFTDTARAALLWVLWHHQGGSSPVGQPIRFALGMGQHDRLNEHQLAEAKRWERLHPANPSVFPRGTALVPPAHAGAPTAQAAPAHPDDAAVDALAATMKAKLAKQRAKGYSGWDTPECTQQHLSDMLRAHVDKGDPVDVANFCAFLAARGEGIAQAAPVARGGAQDPLEGAVQWLQDALAARSQDKEGGDAA